MRKSSLVPQVHHRRASDGRRKYNAAFVDLTNQVPKKRKGGRSEEPTDGVMRPVLSWIDKVQDEDGTEHP